MASSSQCTDLANAINAFAAHLYQTVRDGRKEKNLFFSPHSISTVLAMTHLGARGDTATQIADVSRFSQVGLYGEVHSVFKELNQLLYKERSGYELRAGNKLYGKSGYNFEQTFLEETASYYDSAFEAVADFTSPAALKSINDWIAEKTEGKIRDVIAPGVLDQLTRLVLVNAIYFKGNWESKFNPESTTKDVFKVTDDREKVPVSMMMMQDGRFMLATDTANDCLVLEMPYEGRNADILIALPNKADGLDQLESKLSVDLLQSWNNGLRYTFVNILMPKFKLEDQFDLKDVLKSMGMPDAFDIGKANFEGISEEPGLHISAVIHKTFVDMTEKGTEAAAATCRLLLGGATPFEEEPVQFRADHPFLFMICHRYTRSILFMGRVMDPS